jgi:hypothetical protein
MRLLFAKIVAAIFCIGCMVGLGMLWKYAVDNMSSVFQSGFIAGALFVGAIWALVYFLERREDR